MRPVSFLVMSYVMFLATSMTAAQESNRPGAGPAKLSVAKMIHETVTITQGDAKLSCYLARQDSATPLPGLLLIHEWWGLNDWVKQQADRYAQKGYVVLAVDLYRGEVAADRDHAHELMRGLSDDRAMADLRAGFDYLVRHEATKGQRIGVMGWCMGGGFALKLAIAEPKVACTVVCYGRPVTDVAELRKIKGPLLGIWGETDRGIEVEPFKKALNEAGVKATHHIYPGAGHAFLNETNKKGYHAEQAKKAWGEIEHFLEANLRK
ncbi:MAG TPA: dienelactone hydrolase family protein [Phycisphaerae bacterium]|nr:dienelactone hydrolase family protein [Phycisphaerae bacterium]